MAIIQTLKRNKQQSLNPETDPICLYLTHQVIVGFKGLIDEKNYTEKDCDLNLDLRLIDETEIAILEHHNPPHALQRKILKRQNKQISYRGKTWQVEMEKTAAQVERHLLVSDELIELMKKKQFKLLDVSITTLPRISNPIFQINSSLPKMEYEFLLQDRDGNLFAPDDFGITIRQ